eukprot:scaffold32609_cov20-Tisochrysis_lutea.AAC.1
MLQLFGIEAAYWACTAPVERQRWIQERGASMQGMSNIILHLSVLFTVPTPLTLTLKAQSSQKGCEMGNGRQSAATTQTHTRTRTVMSVSRLYACSTRGVTLCAAQLRMSSRPACIRRFASPMCLGHCKCTRWAHVCVCHCKRLKWVRRRAGTEMIEVLYYILFSKVSGWVALIVCASL